MVNGNASLPLGHCVCCCRKHPLFGSCTVQTRKLNPSQLDQSREYFVTFHAEILHCIKARNGLLNCDFVPIDSGNFGALIIIQPIIDSCICFFKQILLSTIPILMFMMYNFCLNCKPSSSLHSSMAFGSLSLRTDSASDDANPAASLCCHQPALWYVSSFLFQATYIYILCSFFKWPTVSS